MLELKRHAPIGRTRRLTGRDRPRGLPHLYSISKRRPLPDLYVADRAEARRGGRFRWFFSTCLAAAVGAVAIAAVILGSMDSRETSDGVIPVFKRSAEPAQRRPGPSGPVDGLKWAVPKSDRLQATSGAMSTRYIVQESIYQRRGNREYLHNKPYARVVARLAAVPINPAVQIPSFNPFKFYANPTAVGGSEGDGSASGAPEGGEVSVRVFELHGSILPQEDGQEVDNQEAIDLVNRSTAGPRDDADIRATFVPEGAELAVGGRAARDGRAPTIAVSPNTSVLEKTTVEGDDIADDDEMKQVKVRLSRGETLSRLLVRMGADAWQARSMVEAARAILPEASVTSAQEIELTMAPSITQANKLEPVRFSITEGTEHKVTVGRNTAGEFVASATAPDEPASRIPATPGERPLSASLYASIYHAAIALGVQPETIELIFKVHATETDFRRRARTNDGMELFFDLKDEEKGADSPPGDLLFTSLTIGGEAYRYYRFRTSDGVVDYYDDSGNNSRKFMIRRPVRSDDVRLASGFGVRFHPLLNQRKMHTGEDWSGAIGTPIHATANGVIEEAAFKGQYGNYIRIRHANGYQTSYGHMSRFAPTSRPDAKVRQGQIIGYIGNTGLSTGPHVHYEILVNNRFVDPQLIKVPRERKLTGKQLAAFQRERTRIEELMRRPPVRIQPVDGRQ